MKEFISLKSTYDHLRLRDPPNRIQLKSKLVAIEVLLILLNILSKITQYIE